MSMYSRILYESCLGYPRDPAEVFFREDVQDLLQQITGRDFEKVFRNRKLGQRLQPPKYDLLTQAEVEKMMAVTEEKLKLKLKMPPLLNEREEVNNILACNPEIQGFDTAKYVFIDISQGVQEKVSCPGLLSSYFISYYTFLGPHGCCTRPRWHST